MSDRKTRDSESPPPGGHPSEKSGKEIDMTREQKWQQVMVAVTSHVKEKGCHLKPRYALLDLSLETSLPQYIVSKAINQTTGESFSVWMNRFRIEHFLDLLHREGTKDYGIHVLAMRSGFLSKASFIKAFRKEMGMNPGAYAKSMNLPKSDGGDASSGG